MDYKLFKFLNILLVGNFYTQFKQQVLCEEYLTYMGGGLQSGTNASCSSLHFFTFHSGTTSIPWEAYKPGYFWCSWLITPTHTHVRPSKVLICTHGWRQAIEIKHFAQICKHADPARNRTRHPMIKGHIFNSFWLLRSLVKLLVLLTVGQIVTILPCTRLLWSCIQHQLRARSERRGRQTDLEQHA